MGPQRTILVVDDEDKNRRVMEAMLAPLGHKTLLAQNGKEALDMASNKAIDLILLDVMMPGINGFEVAVRLKQDERTSIIPIVMVTSLRDREYRVRALEVGVDDFLSKPADSAEVTARVRSLLKVKAYNDHMRNYQHELEFEVSARTKELAATFEKLKAASLETISRLASAAEYKDEDTGEHIIRMSHFSAAIARQMGQPSDWVERLLYAAPMHDIGKIGIPDQILLKPGKLDANEWITMKTHSVIGAEILKGSDSDFIQLGEQVALAHHEKWDGSGYPQGLAGADIPLSGRIVAIADTFDALTSKRPYKEPFTVEKSLSIIKDGRGAHFDPMWLMLSWQLLTRF